MKTMTKAPFLRSPMTTDVIMRDVMIALIPVCVMAVVHFGFRVILMLIVGMFSAVFFEYAFQKYTKQTVTIDDLSAAVTGLLVALSYPVTAPFWILLLGSFIAIVCVKQCAGGLGKNYFNPAVFSRVLIKILFTPWMTNWVSPGLDAVSVATPLEFIGNGQNALANNLPPLTDLLVGNIGGGIGETTKWAIAIGFVYLVARRVIRWEVPVATLAGLFLMGMLFSGSNVTYALYHVLSGTAIFAAVYMVTDYSSSPMHRKARIFYALAIGILTGLIRYAFDFPGGIGIAILLMNLIAPLFDAWNVPRVFGEKGKRVIFETR